MLLQTKKLWQYVFHLGAKLPLVLEATTFEKKLHLTMQNERLFHNGDGTLLDL